MCFMFVCVLVDARIRALGTGIIEIPNRPMGPKTNGTQPNVICVIVPAGIREPLGHMRTAKGPLGHNGNL